MEKRVAVTGLGVLSCIGNNVDTFWRNIKEGVCGIDYFTEFPTDGFSVKIGGKIRDFDPLQFGMDKAFARKQDAFVIYAVASAWQAMTDAGLTSGENIDPYRLGAYIGSGTGGYDTIMKAAQSIIEDPSGQWVPPTYVPNSIANMAPGQVAIRFNARGVSLSLCTACASSTHALGEAYLAVKSGRLDAVIAGGTDHCAIPIGIAGFANCKALTRDPDPKHACRPFDKDRAGFVMADGSATLILEDYDHAVARGAHIYAEIVGYGATTDAFHATAPRPDGEPQAKAISMALGEAGFDPSKDNLYINAHGTGTILNDVMETKACKAALGDFAPKAHISSTKSMHGHMLGATGAAEAITCILALRDGIVPPTLNCDEPDPECDLDYTPHVAVKSDLTIAISNSFGFGGHNGCIAFRKTR